MKKLLLLVFVMCSMHIRATDIPIIKQKPISRLVSKIKDKEAHPKKWIAAAFDLSLGLFGVHRLYLGTAPKVPVIYTFTLGGGGVLVVADLVAIVMVRDLEKFSNNPQIIMWSE